MKKIFALLLALCLVLALAACGSQPAAKENVKIRVAASPTPHAEILAIAKEVLAAEGYDLEVVEYDDYVQPNLVVDSGELDANYFQHTPYMDQFNAENGTEIVSAGLIHYEPFGIFAGKTAAIADLADGAKARRSPSPTTPPTAPARCCCWPRRASSPSRRASASRPPCMTSSRTPRTWRSSRWKPPSCR